MFYWKWQPRKAQVCNFLTVQLSPVYWASPLLCCWQHCQPKCPSGLIVIYPISLTVITAALSVKVSNKLEWCCRPSLLPLCLVLSFGETAKEQKLFFFFLTQHLTAFQLCQLNKVKQVFLVVLFYDSHPYGLAFFRYGGILFDFQHTVSIIILTINIKHDLRPLQHTFYWELLRCNMWISRFSFFFFLNHQHLWCVLTSVEAWTWKVAVLTITRTVWEKEGWDDVIISQSGVEPSADGFCGWCSCHWK